MRQVNVAVVGATGAVGEIMRRVASLVKTFKRGAQRGRMTPEALRAIRLALDEALNRIEDALNAPRR